MNDTQARQLFLDIQCWMMDNDYEKTPEGGELFERISRLTGVDWSRSMAALPATMTVQELIEKLQTLDGSKVVDVAAGDGLYSLVQVADLFETHITLICEPVPTQN